jgi:hypothetical protein
MRFNRKLKVQKSSWYNSLKPLNLTRPIKYKGRMNYEF